MCSDATADMGKPLGRTMAHVFGRPICVHILTYNEPERSSFDWCTIVELLHQSFLEQVLHGSSWPGRP